MAPPPKSGSNMGIIIGLGCSGLALLGTIGAVVGVFLVRSKSATPTPVYTPPPPVACMQFWAAWYGYLNAYSLPRLSRHKQLLSSEWFVHRNKVYFLITGISSRIYAPAGR